MKRGIKWLCLSAALSLLLTGCTATGGVVSSAVPADSDEGTATTATTATTAPSFTTTAQPTVARGEGVLVETPKDSLEYKSLPNLFSMTDDQLATMIRGYDIVNTADAAHLPKGVKKGWLAKLRNQGWGMAFSFKNENNTETPIVDPCPEPLNDYDGFRIWVDVMPKREGDPLPHQIQFTFGDWAAGYRTMFLYKFKIPEDGYRGYVTMPFTDFVDGYNNSIPSMNPNGIDYICIQIDGYSIMQDVDVYFADFSAYREVFW